MSRTVIVFLEDCILAAAGKEGRNPKLLRLKRIKLTGQGDSFERWKQALTGLSAEWKTRQVQLVLPVGMCSSRVLKIPYAKGKQLADMASKEVADNFRNEVADYSILYSDKKGGIELCAGGADSGQLDRFESICREAGITVGGVTVPMEGYLGMLRLLEGYWNGTGIYLFFEESSMASILCQDGHYLYSGRSRLFSEPGTLDFGTEIVRSISGILQFYASTQKDAPITDVYYAGCPREDFEVSVEGIGALGLKASPFTPDDKISLPPSEKTGDWIPCIGAMICEGKRDKQINLYEANKQKARREEKNVGSWRHLVFPLAVFLACLIPAAALAALNFRASREILSRQEWIASSENEEQYAYALSLEGQLAGINGSIAAVEATGQNLAGYPKITEDVLRRIESAGGADITCQITGYDASTGVLTFEASSREVIDVPSYILKLQESGLFHIVDYLGYDYENEWYTLILSCAMEGRDLQGGDAK